MTRFWVGWYSGNYADEGCTKPPFKFWVSGYLARPNYGLRDAQYEHYLSLDTDVADGFLDANARDDCSICAVVDADDEAAVWELVAAHFPDWRARFCEGRASDFVPGDRFQ